MKIRLLKTTTIRELYGKIADNLDKYRSGDFSFLQGDASKYFEADQEVDAGRIAEIRSEADDYLEVANCELMFAALPGMTPYMARDERFWLYLTHTDLLNCSRMRWPIPSEDEKAIGHIQTHFFVKGARGLERDNAASRLWWMAHISSRCETLSLKETLECFLFRSDVRANIVERPTTAQNPVIFSAILEKLNESYHGNQALYNRQTFRDFMIQLNLIGGVRLLDSLDNTAIRELVASVA